MMADQDEDLVDVDPHDPSDGSLSVFRWKQAGRENLATRRQLREMGLRPGGHEPVARIECRGGKRWAWLYRIDLAKPKLPMTLAKEAALDKAMAARQTCGTCHRRYFHCLPLRTLGSCLECYDGTPAAPDSYMRPPGGGWRMGSASPSRPVSSPADPPAQPQLRRGRRHVPDHQHGPAR